MELNEIISTLQSKTLQIEPSIFAELSKLKKGFVISGEEDRANEIWFYETVARVHSEFFRVYELLKDDEYEKYSTAWCQLERIENAIGCIRENYPERLSEFSLSHIESTIFNLQRIFPYKFFFSRESVIKKSECSICHKETAIRHPCAHKTGRLYAGELCCAYITEAALLSVSIVENPADKFGVLTIKGKKYNYEILQQLMKNWDNPLDEWSVEVLNVLKPEYRDTGRNTTCPCGSKKKYKHCCFDTPNEKMEHFQLTIRNKPFLRTPMEVLRTTIPANNDIKTSDVVT
jgi:hypothetical protein